MIGGIKQFWRGRAGHGRREAHCDPGDDLDDGDHPDHGNYLDGDNAVLIGRAFESTLGVGLEKRFAHRKIKKARGLNRWPSSCGVGSANGTSFIPILAVSRTLLRAK